MSNHVFKFNKLSGKTHFTTLASVHYVQELSDDDREALSKHYETDMSKFQTSIKFFDKQKNELSTNSLKEFKEQGISFVNIGGGQMFPADNFHQAESLLKKEKEELEENKQTTLKNNFRSRVHTKTGQVFWSVRHPSQITQAVHKATTEAQENSISNGQGAPTITPD